MSPRDNVVIASSRPGGRGGTGEAGSERLSLLESPPSSTLLDRWPWALLHPGRGPPLLYLCLVQLRMQTGSCNGDCGNGGYGRLCSTSTIPQDECGRVPGKAGRKRRDLGPSNVDEHLVDSDRGWNTPFLNWSAVDGESSIPGKTSDGDCL